MLERGWWTYNHLNSCLSFISGHPLVFACIHRAQGSGSAASKCIAGSRSGSPQPGRTEHARASNSELWVANFLSGVWSGAIGSDQLLASHSGRVQGSIAKTSIQCRIYVYVLRLICGQKKYQGCTIYVHFMCVPTFKLNFLWINTKDMIIVYPFL